MLTSPLAHSMGRKPDYSMRTGKDHPFVFVNRQDIDRAKVHLQQNLPWAKAAQNLLLQNADKALTLEVPRDYPYAVDTAEKFGEAGLRCATAYLITGDSKYQEKAKAMLLGLARGFRVDRVVQSNYMLDFARRLPSYVYMYDVLYPSLAKEDRNLVEMDFLIPAARALQEAAYHPTSNIRSWHNFAVGAVGFVLENKELAGWAINTSEGGFKDQIARGIGKDGLWWEGSPAYHLYALIPLTMLADASTRSGGEDLYLYRTTSGRQLRNMFDSLFQIADPQSRLPNNNDGNAKSILEYGSLFETVYSYHQDPTYAWLLSQSDRPRTRSDIFLLEAATLFGEPLGRPKPPVPSETILKDSGWAILRQTDDANFWQSDALYVMLDFGPHGGAHGHADKLNLDIVGYKTRLAVDRSQYWYSEPPHDGWERQTLAHNTLMLDQRSQPGAREPFDAEGVTGKLLHASRMNGIQVVEASAEDAYAQTYKRTVALTDRYIVDIFEAAESESHTYDWVLHGPGASSTFSLTGFSPFRITTTAGGYGHLTDSAKASTTESFWVRWAGLQTTIMGGTATDVIRAMGPGGPEKTQAPLVIVRRVAPKARFVAVHEPFKDAPVLKARTFFKNDQVVGLEIKFPDRVDYLMFASGPSARMSQPLPDNPTQSITLNGKYAYLSVVPGKTPTTKE